MTSMVSITGLGPHGERAVPGQQVSLTDAESELARARGFTVAVVLHTTASDWSRQELAGIVAGLGRHSAAMIEAVDCSFDAAAQVSALDRLVRERPDAIISIPIGNIAIAEAHRRVAASGIKLILLDNAPTGMQPGLDYESVVSADNFGLGSIAAELLSPHVQQNGKVGILSFGVDFFATHEREIAFGKWIAANRADVHLVRAKFGDVSEAGRAVLRLVDEHADLSGVFAVWDVPAMHAVRALVERDIGLPMTAVDLGNELAANMASGGSVVGVAAQLPFEQGIAAANAALLSLVGRRAPPWIALPGVAVDQSNLIAAYQLVWHSPAPAALLSARRRSLA